MLRILVTIAFVFTTITISSAQGNLLKEAQAFFDKKQYQKALNGYAYYNRNKPGDMDVLTKMGICYYHVGQTDLAKKSLQAVLGASKKPDANTLLYVAKAMHAEGDFANAAVQYKRYLQLTKSNNAYRKQVRDDIRRCGRGIQLSSMTSDAIVENIGTTINTVDDDYGAVLSPNYNDRIYFSSIRPSNVGGKRTDQGIPDIKYGNFNSDVFVATVNNGSWNDVQRMDNGLNSVMDDHVLDFSKNGQVIALWQSKNGYSGDVLVDTFSRDDIRRQGKFLGPLQGWNGDGGLNFYNDTTALFYSNRPGGYGGMDIYAAFFDGANWSKAFNLGPTINTPYDEISPFLSNDGSTIYFSSNGLNSVGGFDVFQSTFNVGQQEWGSPENVGAPINSGKDDYQFRLDNRGQQAYLTSNRPGGNGGLDIYIAYFKNYRTEQRADFTMASLDYLRRNTTTTTELSAQTDVPIYDDSQITNYNLKPIYYNNNDQVILPENQGVIESALQILRENEAVQLDIVGSTDEGASTPFDLYASIKRAEDLSTYVQQQGIDASRVTIRGVGPNYPVVRHTVNGQPVIIGKKLNRRLDLIMKKTEGLPIEVSYALPSVNNSQLQLEGIAGLRQQARGISYRVEVAEIPNMYMGDIIFQYPDVMIDRAPGKTLYRYTVGSYSTYRSADFMKKDLIGSGITDAKVVAFVDGIEIDKNDVSNLSEKYPDLLMFIAEE